MYNELVTFHMAQVLPRYLITLTPDLAHTKHLRPEFTCFTLSSIEEKLKVLTSEINTGPLGRALLYRLKSIQNGEKTFGQKELIELGHLMCLIQTSGKAQASAQFLIRKISDDQIISCLALGELNTTLPFPSFFEVDPPSLTPALARDLPFAKVENYIQKNSFDQALQELLFLLPTNADSQKCYQCLITILPHIKKLHSLFDHLPFFFKRSANLSPAKFANHLSTWYEKEQGYAEAIYCTAKAFRDDEEAFFQRTSELFSKIIFPYLKAQVQSPAFLEKTAEEYGAALEHFQSLLAQEEVNHLDTAAIGAFNKIPSTDQQKYALHREKIVLPCPPVTKKYIQAFQLFLDHFSTTAIDIRTFQAEGLKKLQHSFQILVNDAALMLGPAPYEYDLLAIGLFGREETVFALGHLECVLVVENNDPYFSSLMEIVDAQILTLGKKIKWRPIQDVRVAFDPTCLRATSLVRKGTQVFAYYRKFCLSLSTPTPKFIPVAFDKEQKISLATLKKHYLEPLNQFLDNLALHHKIDKIHSFDLIDGLIKIEAFTETSGNRLKRTLTDLYRMSLRLSKENLPLSKEEINALHRCQWLIFDSLSSKLPYKDLKLNAQVKGCVGEYKMAALRETLRPWIVPYKTAVKVKGPISGYLHPDVDIFNEKGDIRSFYKSAHNVCPFKNLHFKQKPSQPLMEYAIYNLFSRCAGFLSPPSLLVRFKRNGRSYPVLISQTIDGDHPKDGQNQDLDMKQWTRMLLCSILTRPGDGRLSNFVLNNGKIYSVDNDVSFVEPVISYFYRSDTIQFCSHAFFMNPLDTHLDQEVLQKFARLDRTAILDGWIADVIQKEKEYTALFTEDERKLFYNENPKLSFTPKILFKEGALATLDLQFWLLQKQIHRGEIITSGNLLEALISIEQESVGVNVYNRYHTSTTVQEATSRKDYSMTFIEANTASLGRAVTYKEIEAKTLFSPEEARNERYSMLLLEGVGEFKVVGDTFSANLQFLQEDASREIVVLKTLSVRALASKSSQLSLIYSKELNTSLLALFLHPGLLSLDLRHCTKLDNETVELIQKQCPELKRLLLKGCTGITGIRKPYFNPLLKFPKLEEADFSHCTALKNLELDAPLLKSLNIKHNHKLQNCNKELILVAIRQFPKAFQYADESLKKDRDFIVEAVKQNGLVLEHAPENFKKDRHIILAAIQQNGAAFKHADISLKNDKYLALTALKQNKLIPKYAYESLKKDIEVILSAISEDGGALQYADESLKKDEDFMLTALKQNGLSLQYADESFKKNKDFLLKAVVISGVILEYTDESLKKDENFILAAVEKNPLALQYADASFRKDANFVLAAVEKNPLVLRYADASFQEDKPFILKCITEYSSAFQYLDLREHSAFVLAACTLNGLVLQYANKSFKKDKAFLLKAIKRNCAVFQYVNKSLKKDRSFLLQCVKENSDVLQYVNMSFKDKEFVLDAVRENGLALQYANESAKKEITVVLAALKQKCSALQYADNSLKQNKDFILKIVKENGLALQYADDSLKQNKDFILKIVRENGLALQYAHESAKKDINIVLAAFNENRSALQYADESLKQDRDFLLRAGRVSSEILDYADLSLKANKDIVLAAVTQNGLALQSADASLKANKDVVLAAVTQNGLAFRYADESLKQDRDFFLRAVSISGEILEYADASLKANKETVLAALRQNGRALLYASENLKKDEDVVLAAVTQNGLALQYADASLKANKDVVLAALRQNGRALSFASENLKKYRLVVLVAVTQNGLALQYAAENVKKDKGIVLIAMQQNPLAYQYADANLIADKDFLATPYSFYRN